MLSNSRPSSFSLSTTSTEFTPLDLHIGALPSFDSSSELTGSLERGSKLFRSSSIAVPTVSPDPGNTLETAYNIGTLSDTRTFTDAVSSSDTSDFYRFSLDNTSNLNLSLTGLSSDADVRLIQDVNSNGIVDDSDEIVRSAWGGSNDESINHSLAAGTYFAQVYQYSGDTNYNLSLSVTSCVVDVPTTYLPFDSSQVFNLNSNADANHIIYLDFDGHTTTGTAWNNQHGNNIVTPAFDTDGNTSSFSNDEQETIWRIWQRVS
jgi:hypothetical protein